MQYFFIFFCILSNKFKKKCEFGKKFNLSIEMVKYLYDTQCLCFTEWKKFKLSKALDLKKGVEVY